MLVKKACICPICKTKINVGDNAIGEKDFESEEYQMFHPECWFRMLNPRKKNIN